MNENNSEGYSKSIKIMDEGGKILCPFCQKGYIKKMNDAVYICDNCRRGIVRRVSNVRLG